MTTLNERYTKLSMKRRYEVWFLRLGLLDGSGAWWFRYLLMNPGERGSAGEGQKSPVQVWATWFPREGKPATGIEGFALEGLRVSGRDAPLQLQVGENGIDETGCRGELEAGGRRICWDLRFTSNFRTKLSNKGWIGFSHTPHSDAVFSGEIALDGRRFSGEPLGYGVQGHNCGFRHRKFWSWTHLHFPDANGSPTFEALVYEMPFGLVFRRAVLWHGGKEHRLGSVQERVRDPQRVIWQLVCSDGRGTQVGAEVRAREGQAHRLPYRKTDNSGEFEVTNDSLAEGRLVLRLPGQPAEEMTTRLGAVLEMVGNYRADETFG